MECADSAKSSWNPPLPKWELEIGCRAKSCRESGALRSQLPGTPSPERGEWAVRQCPRVIGKLCFARGRHRGVHGTSVSGGEGRSPSPFLFIPQDRRSASGGMGARGLKTSSWRWAWGVCRGLQSQSWAVEPDYAAMTEHGPPITRRAGLHGLARGEMRSRP